MTRSMSSPHVPVMIQLPAPWHRLVDILSSRQDDALDQAVLWLAEYQQSQYVARYMDASWSSLLEALTIEEPCDSPHGLIFKSRFSLFPSQVQRNILSLLYQQKEKIQLMPLETFLKKLNSADPNVDSWCQCLHRLLSQHCIKRTLDQSGPKERKTSIQKQKSNKQTKHEPGYTFSSQDVIDDVTKLTASIKSSASTSMHAWRFTSKKRRPVKSQENLNTDGNLSFPAESQPPAMFDVSTPERVTVLSQVPEGSPVKRLKYLSSQLDLSSLTPDSQTSEDHWTVDPELQAQVAKLKELWHNMTEPGSEAPEEIAIFTKCTSDQMESICEDLDMSGLSEFAMATACQHFITIASELSYTNSLCFAKHCILPKVLDMSQSCSRTLQAAIQSYGQLFPKQLIIGVLVPVSNASDFNAPQADVVSRLLKDVFSEEQKQLYLSEILLSTEQWADPVLAILQYLIDSKINLEAGLVSRLVSSMENNSQVLCNNLKFAKLVLALVNKYGKQLSTEHISSLTMTVENSKTFLKRAITSALKKLSK